MYALGGEGGTEAGTSSRVYTCGITLFKCQFSNSFTGFCISDYQCALRKIVLLVVTTVDDALVQECGACGIEVKQIS
jgi:hypothetical protein